MEKKIESLQRKIESLKEKLVAIGDLRPGSLSEQYNVCGNPNCRCKANPPQKHGPYHQLSWSRNGKSRTRFVKKPQLPLVREQMKNYARFQDLLNQWIDTSIELCDLKVKLAAEKTATREKST
jgi:Family of unknown function (DUF6788)